VTRPLRWSWVRLGFWEESQSRATSGEEPVMKKTVRFLGLDVQNTEVAPEIRTGG